MHYYHLFQTSNRDLKYVIEPLKKKYPLTPEIISKNQIGLLALEALEISGKKIIWHDISSVVRSRISQSCLVKWRRLADKYNRLNLYGKPEPFSTKNLKTLQELVKKYGPLWNKFLLIFPQYTDSQLYYIYRKHSREN
ncbi:hypothetical protein AYI68_g6005 [Smittium mucronatum]|uniref:Myb-like domain-containing protein n=1 Tax=Smittium mucronatum TaxID=133383 RepID=A0A1R0GSP1_9FUNG|nr:hypothetical protein AYI68_g6005 [Smittium mucronatum]